MSENRPPSPEYDDDAASATSTPPQPPPFSPGGGPSYDLVDAEAAALGALLAADNLVGATTPDPSVSAAAECGMPTHAQV
jgi:hypothetical protein